MEFLISQVTVSPLVLALTGFVVGVLGGFFGVGGGFLAGPMMFWAGVPINFVIGTDLAHMTGKSIVATRSHRALGHVDIRLAGLMIIGTIPGVEIGAQIIERLKDLGNIEQVICISYVVILCKWRAARKSTGLTCPPTTGSVLGGQVNIHRIHLKPHYFPQ